jgi:hypothetical protein
MNVFYMLSPIKITNDNNHSILSSASLALIFAIQFVGCSDRPKNVEIVLDSEKHMPTSIDCGHVKRGATFVTKVQVRNELDFPAEIDSCRTSCECTSILGLPCNIPAGGSREIEAFTDLSKENGFVGGLGVIVNLQSGNKTVGEFELLFKVENPTATAAPGGS